jgi:adenylate/nucleoside-diphosphate kinase
MLGPRGAGKTLHGRDLAKKLGLFHIQFRERLQELVISKTKKRVRPDREEEQELEEQDLPPEEEYVVDYLFPPLFS